MHHRKPDPIIRTLLDVDFYKFAMLQYVWKHHADVQVTYRFINRTKNVRLADFVSVAAIKHEVAVVRRLRFVPSELRYLGETGCFTPDFLVALKLFKGLPPISVGRTPDGQLDITITGNWFSTMLWETLILSIVNELYFRKVLRLSRRSWNDELWKLGSSRIDDKIARLIERDIQPAVIEFGTRRRFSRNWQVFILNRLLRNSCLVGTSNVYLARTLGVRPIGTMAHELFMVTACLESATDADLRLSQVNVLRRWWEMYGTGLSIALTDTFGTSAFFEDFAPFADDWRGLRQDSGDPEDFGERAIAFYRSLGIDPMSKIIVFSDGLDVDTICRLQDRFQGRIQMSFGWGTDLTNDLGFAPLSLVVKIVEVAGCPAVKLSDTLAKAIGPHAAIDRYVRVFNYAGGDDRTCRY